jgi:molybdenum cofactor synthesis domain-containing protein
LISILVIGDEILAGQVKDTNLAYMFEHLNREGYPIQEVAIVGDTIEAISEALNRMRHRSEFVISCGGIGPTHDDVTMEAYAHAFKTSVFVHPELEEKLRDYYGDRFEERYLTHARVPKKAHLLDSGNTAWPIVACGNCFILPGLPEIFVKKFHGVLNHLPQVSERFYAALLTHSEETLFAETLSELQHIYPECDIGSYPVFDRSEYSAKVTIKSRDLKRLTELFHKLESLFVRMDSLVRTTNPRPFDPAHAD